MQMANIYNENCLATLSQALKSMAGDASVFMCIGTEKVLSDSLGPRVGEKLNNIMDTPVYVYGLEKANITAENLAYSYEFIKQLHPDKKIVVVDAGVGAKEQIGDIQICHGGIVPGAATNKNLPQVGDISIVGIVAEKGLKDFYTTNYEKMTLVDKLADFISQAVVEAKQN